MNPQIPKAPKKPVIALMGEFSAGKSTLANLLICEGRSPVKVTATQLPPVWFTYGEREPYAVDLAGNRKPVDLENIEATGVADTNYIRIFLKTDILELMDIIDMPGNSDPNMPSEVWQRVIHHADAVIWCSHATQAWRQSEAATWAEQPRHLYPVSMLLLTRFDKLLKEQDRARVLNRVRAETKGQFRGVYPLSLLEAMNAVDNHDLWVSSGAEAFVQALLDVALEIKSMPQLQRDAVLKPQSAEPAKPSLRVQKPTEPQPLRVQQPPENSGPSILPRRVERAAEPGENRPRPPRDEARRPVA